MRPQIEIASRECFPNARQTGMPLVARPGAEAIVPRRIRHLRVTVVRPGGHPDWCGMRVQPKAARRGNELLTHAKRPCRREWVRLIMRQENVVLVAANSDDAFDFGKIEPQLVV